MAWKNKSKRCCAYWVSIVTEPLVYSICLKGFPGANQALENLQRTTGLTRHIRLASTHPDSPEIAFVGELVRTLQPVCCFVWRLESRVSNIDANRGTFDHALWGLLDEQRRTDRHVARNGKTCRALGIARHRIPRLEQSRDGKCLASCRNPRVICHRL